MKAAANDSFVWKKFELLIIHPNTF